MSNILRIGECASLGTAPFYFPLKHVFNEPSWSFVSGTPEEIGSALERGEVDVALVSPLVLVSSPLDFVVFPDVGYAARRHVKEMLLFSDILLDDMDELTVCVQDGALTSTAIVKTVLGRYLQYQNQFISGWGPADGYVLEGDGALRERLLARYAYVYDVGDLWRHYTRLPMIYHLWVARRESVRVKEGMVILFQRLLKQAVEITSSDWRRLSVLLEGYSWLRKDMAAQLWNQIEYKLQPEHFTGLTRFYEDLADIGAIEEAPELVMFEPH